MLGCGLYPFSGVGVILSIQLAVLMTAGLAESLFSAGGCTAGVLAAIAAIAANAIYPSVVGFRNNDSAAAGVRLAVLGCGLYPFSSAGVILSIQLAVCLTTGLADGLCGAGGSAAGVSRLVLLFGGVLAGGSVPVVVCVIAPVGGEAVTGGGELHGLCSGLSVALGIAEQLAALRAGPVLNVTFTLTGSRNSLVMRQGVSSQLARLKGLGGAYLPAGAALVVHSLGSTSSRSLQVGLSGDRLVIQVHMDTIPTSK